MFWKISQFIVFITLSLVYVKASDDIFQIDIDIRNHRFEPSVFDAPVGRRLKLVIHNKDDTIEEFESFDLKREKIVPANGQVNIILAPLEEGRYEFFGDFNQETARGVLNVK
jgi:hypothetical protein